MSIFEKLFHTNKGNKSDKEDKNMKIAVICANGKAGKLIVKEALDRKLDVTAVVRGENKTEASQVTTKDLFDLTAADLKGFDVVIDAFGAWTEDTLPLHSTSLKHLCDILSGTDTRLLVVGGAGSLYVNAEHTAQVMDGPDFPDVFKPLASNMGKALSELRQRKDVRWTYISPAGDFQAEGERTGSYLLGGEELTLNSRGESTISYADYAIAMVDEAVTARDLLDENYIQHNLAYGTGEDAFISSVEYLASADVKTTVENIRSFEDGDYVFLQTVYNFAGAGEQVAFDIFRFDEDGEIAEHWDNLAALAAEPNPSGHTQIDGTMEVTDLDKTEENRELVKNFLYDVMQGNNPDKTADYFDGDAYIQHNTAIADGVSGLNAALTALAEQGIQMIYDETHMVLAQGNFVLAVSEGTYGGAPTSYYDLWRVENGKIAEHWDVMETIADQSTWQNDNGKF